MYIDAEVMKDCLKRLDNLNKGRISKRFSYTKSVFDEMEGIKVEIDEFPKVVKWEDEKIKSLGSDIRRNIFSPCNLGLTNDKRYGGVLLQKKYFEDERFDKKIAKSNKHLNSEERGELVKDILSIIGGFDSRRKMKDEYRILSNAQTSKDDFDSTLQSNGQYAWINSHFADNTLFCEFVDFVKKCKADQNTKIDSEWYKNIALCYPYADEKKTIGKLSGEKKEKPLEGQEAEKQREILAYRFPLKFLWMWANQGDVIHPLSLMAFREFLKSDFMKNILDETTPKNLVNLEIGKFVEQWKTLSDKIMQQLVDNWEKTLPKEKKEHIHQVSLLISLLTLSETNMTNIDELLKTHKQIILYGVPGTGKTHSAKELIREWGEIAIRQEEKKQKSDMEQQEQEKPQQMNAKEDILEKCHFNKFLVKDNKQATNPQDGEYADIKDPIVWEIMQFHPNTTYQDFIGGIIPKTGQNDNLTYKVESGKFKKFCECAGKEENKSKKFVFIIDEINRANLSEVLGELLYALEYRDEEITIPNFDEPFVIPNNVYIIGTMNNVDKSLSTFDLALRRRFGFYEVGVDCEVIEKMLEGKVEKDCLEKYIERCQDLNALISGDFDEEDKERLSKEENNTLKLEKHYKIGQAYFAKIEKFFESNESNEITPIHLTKLWDYHLQPLIEEYIGFSMGNQEISNKLDNLKAFWIRELK
ncbi:MAG TPA: AAA family ATPase [Candidatus Helicobacter avistercoris]|nr:AAA family ATPase [Candidatus Helicobacter avistercoris]